jgi:hypothetical protein
MNTCQISGSCAHMEADSVDRNLHAGTIDPSFLLCILPEDELLICSVDRSGRKLHLVVVVAVLRC